MESKKKELRSKLDLVKKGRIKIQDLDLGEALQMNFSQ